MSGVDERAVLIRIPRLYRPTMTREQLYEATRKWWRLNPDRDPDYALSIYQGVVKAVYRIDDWEQPPPAERVGRLERRWAFAGVPDVELERKYVGTDVSQYFSRGNSNPVRYVNC